MGGFNPTVANASQWASNWVMAGLAHYTIATQTFKNSVRPPGLPPFAGTGKVWFWGFQCRGEVSQMILCTNPAWTWPAADEGLSTTINLANANQFVVGSVHPSTFGMTFAAVAAPVRGIQATDWKIKAFRQSDTATTTDWNADPDGDGVVNRLEYLLGSNPLGTNRSNSGYEAVVVDMDAQKLRLKLRRPSHVIANYTAEVSSDCLTWTSSATAVETLVNTNSLQTFRDRTTTLTAPGGRRFIRLKGSF